MSLLSSLQDSAIVYTSSSGHFGKSQSIAVSGTPRNCMIQTLSVSESSEYSARGQRASHIVFFTADPNIANNNWLKVTWISGKITWLRVTATETESTPSGDTVVWNIVGEEISAVEVPAIV